MKTSVSKTFDDFCKENKVAGEERRWLLIHLLTMRMMEMMEGLK